MADEQSLKVDFSGSSAGSTTAPTNQEMMIETMLAVLNSGKPVLTTRNKDGTLNVQMLEI